MSLTEPTIHIRDGTLSDTTIIASFNQKMAVETEGEILDPELIHAGVAALLADQSKGRYWVAEINGEIAGQLMITYEWSDWRNGNLWWIQSVYVPEKYRRRGVFSALYQHLESMAESDPGVAGIRLYVEKENTHAKKTYLSLGMSETNYDVMQTIFKPSAKDNA